MSPRRLFGVKIIENGKGDVEEETEGFACETCGGVRGGEPLIADAGGLGGEGHGKSEMGLLASETGGAVGHLVGDPVRAVFGGEEGGAGT